MTRQRPNNVLGTLGAQQNPGDGTITFLAALTRDDGQALATIAAPDTLDITVDPRTGAFEVERITAYTSGATTATVTRAIRGTARTHLNGATLEADPTDADFDGSTQPIAGAVLAQRVYCR